MEDECFVCVLEARVARSKALAEHLARVRAIKHWNDLVFVAAEMCSRSDVRSFGADVARVEAHVRRVVASAKWGGHGRGTMGARIAADTPVEYGAAIYALAARCERLWVEEHGDGAAYDGAFEDMADLLRRAHALADALSCVGNT